VMFPFGSRKIYSGFIFCGPDRRSVERYRTWLLLGEYPTSLTLFLWLPHVS